MPTRFDTHDVLNQSPPFEDHNLFTTDRALMEAVEREGGGSAMDELRGFGATAGSAHAFELARLANENPPRLRTFDQKGRRLDVVEYHPAYHHLMELSVAAGLAARAWDHLRDGASDTEPLPGRHVTRAAGLYMAAQMEPGHCCPITMTNAAVPTLTRAPMLAEAWLPRALSRRYDPSFAPANRKTAVTFGMGMTEKQGGTDVRANTTMAVPASSRTGPEQAYVLTGHKWFMSAPMSDAFLMLAQAQGGLSCFLVPRFLPDGTANTLRFQRLKEKLGNRSNASSEVELQDTLGWMVGEEGRGIATIIEMVTHTRLDCALSSAGLMRLAVANAIHHARHRHVFQRPLVWEPVMTAVLADLALDVEAATALAFRLARAFDRTSDPAEQAYMRLMTPVTKYWVCKIAPALTYEAMECLGGNGYVEDGLAARIYREVPVNAIWEGSGNVMALDVLRVLQREPDVVGMVLESLSRAAGDDRDLAALAGRIEAILHEPRALELRARQLVEALALLAAAVVLRASAPAAVADSFIATRIQGAPRQTYGQGLDGASAAAIVDRTLSA